MNTINKIEAFTPFTATRKAMVKHVKARLVDPENRPTKHPIYGNKNQVLFHEDYAIYAALRGADFKKTSHMPDGKNAREAIESFVRMISHINESQDSRIKEGSYASLNKFLPSGSTYAEVVELREILAQALSA